MEVPPPWENSERFLFNPVDGINNQLKQEDIR